MLSLEYLELISTVLWGVYEKVANFQAKFWFKTPFYWDSKAKKAAFRSLRQTLPLLILSAVQSPSIFYSWLILYRQNNSRLADPRFPFTGAVFVAFGSVMNFFVTVGQLSNFYKRREWSVILTVVGQNHFHGNKKMAGAHSSKDWTKTRITRNLTILDVITQAIFLFLLFLGSTGFLMPIFVDGDPIHYMFLDVVRKGSREYHILKYSVRPIFWGIFSMYLVSTFYTVTANIFFMIVHGCMIIPRVPRAGNSQTLRIIPNSFAIFTVSQKLMMQLMEGAYREYRAFQIFIRPANDAMYIVIPDGLAGIGVCEIISGFVTIKGFTKLPHHSYLVFPSVFFMNLILIFMMVPIACGVFENARLYKHYWLSRIQRKESRKRLVACRPMGIAAGPFGYVRRSLPMEMVNQIVDSICNAMVSVSFK